MDTWTARKRPWEEDSPIDSQFTRRDSTSGAAVAAAAAAARQPSPLPQHAGYYSRDNETLSRRRLPPLYTPSCSSTSAEPATSLSLHFSPKFQEAVQPERSRPRSHSLFDVFQSPKRQRNNSYTGRKTAFPGSLELDRSPPPDGSDAHRPRFGTDPAPHAAGGVICCPSRCEAQACLNGRTLMRKLAAELVLLDSKVRSITKQHHSSSAEPPEVDYLSTAETLQWALDILQWTNFSLDEHVAHPISNSPEQSSPQPDATPTMRRGQHHLEEREEQSPPTRQFSGIQHAYANFNHPLMAPDESRRHPYGSEMTSMANSPHHTTSSSGSAFVPSQSPMQAPQPLRTAILPSPSSMNFPNPQNLPPISPPTTTLQPSAQTAHLQDLQHQISVKTLAFQTLQREYDSLLQKLERQRTKCATLEKKFEVSDVEINTLTDEKEKLLAQVSSMETQVEELQQSRDEARRQLVANGAQYMRIMEMANRLQAQSADDKKKWEAERVELEQRIKVLEEAMLTGVEDSTTSLKQSSDCRPSPTSRALSHNSSLAISPPSSQTETIHVLRAEVSRLRSRTQTLETALQTMKEESISIQEAARQLVESGGKMEKVAQGVTRRGG